MGAPLHCYTGAGGGDFLKSCGVGECKWCCGFMDEATNSFRRHPTSISYVYKVFWHPYMLWVDMWVHPYSVILVCCMPPSYVPYKGTYVPYNGTFGMPDQGQTLDM